MEYTEILKILVELLGTLLGCALLTVIPKLKEWLGAKAEEKLNANTYTLIETFVEAAEQTLKAEDPTGKLRKEYVEKSLVNVGIEVTEAIGNFIESAVFRLPKA